MSQAAAVIFYEDQLAEGKPPREYGPHRLVLACLSDRLQRPIYELQKVVEPVPMKGDTRLLQACDRDVARRRKFNTRVFMLFDRDQIHTRFPNLAKTSPDDAFRQAILQRSSVADLEVQFVDPNLEGVVVKAVECGAPVGDAQAAIVLAKDDLNERDVLFNALAWSAPRSVRDCILDKLPGLKALVEKLVQLLSA